MANITSKSTLSNSFLIYSPEYTSNMAFPILENWFLISIPHNVFFIEWLKEFEKCINSDNPSIYYVNRLDINNLVQNIPQDLRGYLIAFISAQIVLRKFIDDINISCVSSFELGFQYGRGKNNNVDSLLLTRNICYPSFKRDKEKWPYFIKQVGGGKTIQNYLGNKYINKKSMLGRLL